jgi:hypothetical protein
MNAFRKKKSILSTQVEVLQLNHIINTSFHRENFLLFFLELVDVLNTDSSKLLIFIKSLKLDFIKNNEEIEKMILAKKDPILQLHYYYLGGYSNYDRIKSLYENTDNIVQIYKLLKITLFYKDFKNLNCFLEEFNNKLFQSIDKPSYNFYKEYFSLLSQCLSSNSRITNFFTRKVNIDAMKESNRYLYLDITSNFFKLKFLKYSQICVADINDFSKEFICTPSVIVRTLYKSKELIINSTITGNAK